VYEITYRAPTLRAKGLFSYIVLLSFASWSNLAMLLGIRVGAGGFVSDFIVKEESEGAKTTSLLHPIQP